MKDALTNNDSNPDSNLDLNSTGDDRVLFETGLERQSARDRLTQLLGEETIKDLHRRSDIKGWMAVLSCWATIIALLILIQATLNTIGWWGLPLVVAGVFLVGGRILALAILTHEGAHRTLFANAKLNDRVTRWLCAAPVYLDLIKYRKHHAQHHVHTGTKQDVDLPLIEGFPTSRKSLTRKFFRDLSGQTGLKSLVGLAMMNAEVLRWNVTGVVDYLPERPTTRLALLRTFLKNSYRTLIFHTIFFAITLALGAPEIFAIWWAGYLFTYPFCIRVRAIAEHAVTERTGDMLKNTRTTKAGLISRALFAPFNVNFHIEHHALVSVPWWQLPALHQKLQKHQILPEPPSYWQVMKIASTNR
ncbi:MAG: fatty acid desaturase family protein [Thalassolituus sp.]